jgi:hypothetical protein
LQKVKTSFTAGQQDVKRSQKPTDFRP